MEFLRQVPKVHLPHEDLTQVVARLWTMWYIGRKVIYTRASFRARSLSFSTVS